jgi:disulfide oxidoreductase YuzD
MKIILLILSPLWIFAGVHYAKIEPYDSVILRSAVSALVMDVDENAEGSVVHQKRVVLLDDRLDKMNLKISKTKLQTLSETLQRQESYFERMNSLKTASVSQKDTAYYSYASTKTQYLDMQYKIAQLEDSIQKKSLVLQDKYLYKLMVRKGDFVAPGAALAKVMDTSKAKLVLFLEPEELKDLDKKEVYLNGKKTTYRVDKVWKVADEKFISSYRAEIYIDAPKEIFSTLLKVEIK